MGDDSLEWVYLQSLHNFNFFPPLNFHKTQCIEQVWIHNSLINKTDLLGIVAHVFNPSTVEATSVIPFTEHHRPIEI